MKNSPLNRRNCVLSSMIIIRRQPLLTVEQLASELQIGVATVIRTTHHLGYDSFKEFTNTLRTLLMKQESTYWRQLKDSWETG